MISKIDAAKAQLETAIKLFFENVDHVSAYTLSSASREITDDLFRNNRNEILRREHERIGDLQEVRFSIREEYEMRIKPEYLAKARKLMRARQNFLKHADNDPNATIEISVDVLAMHIFAAIMNFRLVAGTWTQAMSVFSCWIVAKKPYLLKQDAQGEFVDKVMLFRQAMAELSNEQEMCFLYRALQANCPQIFAREPPGLSEALQRAGRHIPG